PSVSWNWTSNAPAGRRDAAARSPDNLPISSRFSRPVSYASTAANCPARPITRRTAPGWLITSSPITWALPASGRSRVVRTRTAVVLPAPLRPSSATTAPVGTARSTPASAGLGPNRFTSPRARTARSIGSPIARLATYGLERSIPTYDAIGSKHEPAGPGAEGASGRGAARRAGGRPPARVRGQGGAARAQRRA